MKKVVMSTIATFTFFFFLVSPLTFLIMYQGFHWMSDKSVFDYLQLIGVFVLFYLVAVSIPFFSNIVWETFKQRYSKRIMILVGFVMLVLLLIVLRGYWLF